jgi:hypothetical protein
MNQGNNNITQMKNPTAKTATVLNLDDIDESTLEQYQQAIAQKKNKLAQDGLPANKTAFTAAFNAALTLYRRIRQVDKTFNPPNWTTGATDGRKERIDNAIKKHLPTTMDELLITMQGDFSPAELKAELARVFKDGKPKYTKSAEGIVTANKASRKATTA